MSSSPPVSATKFRQLHKAFKAFHKGKDKISDDKHQDKNKIETSDESHSSSSSKQKEHGKPFHLAVDEDDEDGETVVNLDTLNVELENQFDEIKFMGNGQTMGLTKFPSNEGCEFSKDNAAYIAQLRKCYKTLKTVIGICVAGASCHPAAMDTFDAVIMAVLWGVCGVLAAHCDLYFKGVMGDGFKVWRSLSAGGISSEECCLAVKAMQFSAAAAIMKMPSRFSNATK